MKREHFGPSLLIIAVLLAGPASSLETIRPGPAGKPAPVVKPTGGNLFEAVLQQPVKGTAVHALSGLTWTCVGTRCTARGAAARPTPAQCKALADRVGPLKSCGPAGSKSGGTVTPGPTGPGPGVKPAPRLIKPAPELTTRTPGVGIKPGALQTSRTIRTPRIAITGSPELPAPRAASAPVTIRTSRIAIAGSPDLPAPREPGAPVTIRTGPIRITGDRQDS